MDIQLARTFLEIVSTRSFVRAADRLNVSQTAVSARMHSLESQLGRKLFIRNKSGATLTPAGEEFLRFAPTLVQLWQRACHQVAVPAGRRALLSMGAELSLWNPLILNWLLWMKRSAPEIALRTEVSVPDDLMKQVAAGILDIAVMYRPQNLPGLQIEELLNEKLVLVTTGGEEQLKEAEYVYVDWGPVFSARHDSSFPNRTTPGLYVGLGPLGLSYILKCGGSGYFRKRTAQPYLRTGQLKLVRGAPEFTYPVYAVYPGDGNSGLLEPALAALRGVASRETDEWPIEVAPQEKTSESTAVIPISQATRSRPARAKGSMRATNRKSRSYK